MGWWIFRSKAEESEAEVEEVRSPEEAESFPVADRLLGLQQTIGNQAVQQMITNPGSSAERSPHTYATHGGGEPLPQEMRELMEERFEEDFSDVRIHVDEEAASSAVALDARAYTVGRDVYFGRGMYASKSPEGQRLIAHELTHVVQQDRASGGPVSEHELSEPTDTAEREAEAVAETMEKGGRVPTIVSEGKGIQRDVGWAQRGPLPDPYGELLLLNAFAKKFLDAAKLIHKNPAAMKLVNEAEAAGVQFGGYAEDGPGKVAWPYTVASTKTVYVPKARTDAVIAMSDFLFELNNAIRSSKLAELEKEAAKGTSGKLTAKEYAYKKVEQEVEGMLRAGEIWFEMKKTLGNDPKSDKYDADFFLSQYQVFKAGKKSKDDIVKDVLKWPSGADRTKTTEEYYMDQYKSSSGGK